MPAPRPCALAHSSRSGPKLRYTRCLPILPDVFERAPAGVYDYRRPGASRRRSLGRTADGREILMRTRTSARDIEVTTNLLQRSLNRPR